MYLPDYTASLVSYDVSHNQENPKVTYFPDSRASPVCYDVFVYFIFQENPNVTYFPDPRASPVCHDVLDTHDCYRWTACCDEAVKCCTTTQQESQHSPNGRSILLLHQIYLIMTGLLGQTWQNLLFNSLKLK